MLRRDPCIKCNQPVFLAERLIVSSARLLYHRTCFRCARCNSQLTLANYYETEEGRFCCETCPDEEKRFETERAPLATGDEFPSSSEPSRPPSVTVDTNDLSMSSDACERVNNVDTVESSETEKNAKDRTDQSVSLVQLRRKLFENVPKDGNSDVFDSGQLRVPGAQVSLKEDEPKTDEDKLSQARSEVKLAEEDESPVGEVEHLSKSREDEVPSESTEVEDVTSKSEVVDTSSESRMEVDDKIESEVKEDESLREPLLPKALEDELPHSRAKENETSESCEKEDDLSLNREEETEVPLSRGKEDELRRESGDGLIVNKYPEETKIEEPSIEISPPEDNLQSDDKSAESRKEDDEKQCSEIELRVEVEPSTLEETQSTTEDDAESNEVEEKIDSEKEVKTVLPPRPPPPAVEIRKPPVTPRKTSSVVASPRKSSPVVTPREKSPARPRSYPAGLNPFSDDEEDEEDDSVSKEDSKEVSKEHSKEVSKEDSKEVSKVSLNPFGSDDEDEEEVVIRQKERPPRPSKPPQRPYTHHGVSARTNDTPKTASIDTRRHIPAPANLNPFWDDGEEPEDDEEDTKPQSDSTQVTPQKPPVPKPRTVLSLSPSASRGQPASPFSDRANLTRSSGRFGSANSLSSVVSSASTLRRKKHAAPPPPVSSANTSLSPRATSFTPNTVSVPSSPTLSSGRSTLGRSRKSRPAPKPPSASPITSDRSTWNPSTHYEPPSSDPHNLATSTPKSAKLVDEWQEGKLNKDEMNRSKQNQLSAAYTSESLKENPTEEDESFHSGDKSSHGQWKRKKGPAPPRPIPQRRQIRAIPLKELKRELDDIEVLQLELERQGVNLERTIRRKFDENPDASESSMTPDIEDLVLQLFELVNEKNELFRKQAELMYLRRQQRLEEEHADLEYQIRVLMDQPERNKTDSDKAKEEKLIQRLVEVVERRNEIVECLEMDRLREAEEDHSIHSRLELFASKSLALNDAYINDLYKSTPALTCCARKEKKKKKDKTKRGTLRLHKKDKQVDADKDIDETEVEQTAKEKKTKRKWF